MEAMNEPTNLREASVIRALLSQQKAELKAEAIQRMLEAEIRQTAQEIYVKLLIPYLLASPTVFDQAGSPDVEVVKKLAAVSARCAPYLHQALGLAKVDDAASFPSVVS